MKHPSGEKAGRELDALVAEKVMEQPGRWVNWIRINERWHEVETWLLKGYEPEDPPKGIMVGAQPRPYSTEISSAFKAVKKVRERFGLEFELFAREKGLWDARFGIEDFVCANTAPLVICLAALKAVEGALEELKGEEDD